MSSVSGIRKINAGFKYIVWIDTTEYKPYDNKFSKTKHNSDEIVKTRKVSVFERIDIEGTTPLYVYAVKPTEFVNVYHSDLKFKKGKTPLYLKYHDSFIYVLCCLPNNQYLLIGENIIKFQTSPTEKLLRLNTNVFGTTIYVFIVGQENLYVFDESSPRYLCIKRQFFKSDADIYHQYFKYMLEFGHEIKKYILKIVKPTVYAEFCKLEESERELFFDKYMVEYINKTSIFKKKLYEYADKYHSSEFLDHIREKEYLTLFNKIGKIEGKNGEELLLDVQNDVCKILWEYYLKRFEESSSSDMTIRNLKYSYVIDRHACI